MTEFNEKAFVASIKAEGREEGRLEGLEKGREEKGVQNALTMLKDKMAETLVAKYSGLSLEEVQALAATL